MLNQLVKPEVIAFIREHQNSDLNRLLLNKNKYTGIPVDLVVDQIRALEKAKIKLPQWANTKGVVMPPLLSMEQCSSEEAARYKAGLVTGDIAIDLTGGAGVDTFYLSKRFQKVFYIEENSELAKIAQHNFKKLGATNIEVLNTSAEFFLAKFAQKVDLIYIDPARRDQQKKVFRFEECSPNILPLQKEFGDKAQKVMVKASPMLDITLGVNQLLTVQEVHIVAIKNEVKEVLFIQNTTDKKGIKVIATDLVNSIPFEFVLGEQINAPVGDVQKYVYEPNSAILKSGGMDWLTKTYPIQKLHKNTHLFTSNDPIERFPGRLFKVDQVVKYNKAELNKLVSSGKANVAVRNFPDSVETFRKKTGLKPGGNQYLFGVISYDNKVRVIICTKIKL